VFPRQVAVVRVVPDEDGRRHADCGWTEDAEIESPRAETKPSRPQTFMHRLHCALLEHFESEASLVRAYAVSAC
jgi:hypothetical protein